MLFVMPVMPSLPASFLVPSHTTPHQVGKLESLEADLDKLLKWYGITKVVLLTVPPPLHSLTPSPSSLLSPARF
jgi:hypothetical protein